MDNTSNLKATGNHMISSGLPPIWMEILESIDSDIAKIERQIGMLKECHSQRQRVMFEEKKRRI